MRHGRSAHNILKAGTGGKPQTKMATQILMLKTKCAECSVESPVLHLETKSWTQPGIQIEL